MVLHPEVQKHAQAELLAAVGPDRLPTLADREHLPFTESILKETLRMYPATPLGMSSYSVIGLYLAYPRVLALPHYTNADDTYNGYHIPKGSVVLGVNQSFSTILFLLIHVFLECLVRLYHS